MKPIVIIGTGLAGYSLAKEIRKLDTEIALHLITADAGESYSKPMLSNALAKAKTPQDLAMASAEAMSQELVAPVWTGTRVSAIDAAARQLQTGAGSLVYERLVLAVGATPVNPPLSGDAAHEVLSVNSLADYARFHDALQAARHVAVIGPGLIGCEFANDLIASGRQVTVIGPDSSPLGRLVPLEAGQALQRGMQQAGVDWRLGMVVQSVDRQGQGYCLSLSDGSQLQADLVLSAIGLRPAIELAQQAGLAVARGIVLDRTLQSSDPAIFALGDCAEIEGLVLPFVMPIMHSARALAKTLTGTKTELCYPPMPVVVKTPLHPVVVSPPADANAGAWQCEVQDDGVRALFRDTQGRLLGFALTGAYVKERQSLASSLPAILD